MLQRITHSACMVVYSLFFAVNLYPQINLSTETYSYDEKNALKQAKTVKEAEQLYRKAVQYYEYGNIPRAEEAYSDAMHKLYSVTLDARINYQLRNEFEMLFGKLGGICASTNSVICDTSTKYMINMDKQSPLVQKYIRIYTNGDEREVLIRAMNRSGKYRDLINKMLEEYDLPGELIYLPVVESSYKINNYSNKGALGLWQLMPQTAKNFGLKINYWIDERLDPEKSTRAALRYLKNLYSMFDDWPIAIASYNRGEYGLSRDLVFSKATNFSQLSKRDALPKETENYVPQFMAVTLIAGNPGDYGLNFNPEEPLKYDEISINQAIDLEVIARCTGKDVQEIKELNPALKAWCTPDNYPQFSLKLPAGTKEMFMRNIAKVADPNPSRGLVRYRVRKGESLSLIAKKYGTSVENIKKFNKIKKSNQLQIGQLLVLQPGRKYYSKKDGK